MAPIVFTGEGVRTYDAGVACLTTESTSPQHRPRANTHAMKPIPTVASKVVLQTSLRGSLPVFFFFFILSIFHFFSTFSFLKVFSVFHFFVFSMFFHFSPPPLPGPPQASIKHRFFLQKS